MNRLYRAEILRLLEQDPPLIKDVRRTGDGIFDVELDSYDLSAGTAVWKEAATSTAPDNVKSMSYDPAKPRDQQFVTVSPGQMIFVVTHEEIFLPNDVTATVFSRNKLALDGILALNAGHVDPGYVGPIAIRLINLRKAEWILELGDGIFTIVFDRMVQINPQDQLDGHPAYRKSAMLKRVHQTVADSLSNALLDIFSIEMQRRLNEHYTQYEGRLREDFSKTYLRREELLGVWFKASWKWTLAIGLFIAAVSGAILGLLQYLD